MTAGLNCTLLATRTGFNAYANTLLNLTGGDLNLLTQCKPEVCGSLWGTGNGDISGIGMIIGYVLQQVIGLVLGTLCLASGSWKEHWFNRIPRDSLQIFQDCAIFFTFSLEIAAIIVLVRAEFGISTNGMGDDTIRITQAVAMLVLLPLIYPLVVSIRISPPEVNSDDEETTEPKAADIETIPNRFSLFVVCWAMAFYPFFSKMNAALGKSKINRQAGHINPQQFQIVQNMCFGKLRPITQSEDDFMTALVILAYIPLSVFVIVRIVWLGVEQNHFDSKLHRALLTARKFLPRQKDKYWLRVGFVAIPLLACGLLWSVIRAQRAQVELTASYGGTDQDSDWNFGQIVAVTVFTPVLVEGWRSGSESWKLMRETRQR